MIRKTLFWAHLVSGLAAGLVILMMSVTGVLLTYERQIIALADRADAGPIVKSGSRLSLDEITTRLVQQDPDFRPRSIAVENTDVSAIQVNGERGAGLRLVDPYSGIILGDGAEGARSFFSSMRGWHRWFNVNGEGRAPWRAITGVSNLLFLFLLVSGIYLWLPGLYRWSAFRVRLFFNSRATNSHARDYNWHHVFGAWTVLPLIVIVATATVFSYSWAGDLVYQAFGEAPPSRSRAPEAQTSAATNELETQSANPMSLDQLFRTATEKVSDWNEIVLTLPENSAREISFSIDEGPGGIPYQQHSLVLDRFSGSITTWAPFESQSPGRKARRWIRYLHTGEALGVTGQTVAGMVSLTSVLMVWTGIALAYRRLVVPLLRRQPGNSCVTE